MATFFLVHGTFAPRAEWTQSRSPLQLTFEHALRDKNEPAVFTPVTWSGRNLTRDRLIAADEIAARINALKAECGNSGVEKK
jgi:hypothetical protein